MNRRKKFFQEKILYTTIGDPTQTEYEYALN